ncbi:hypothetical protein AMTRI_Chr07g27790 [Amborella trichopoda]
MPIWIKKRRVRKVSTNITENIVKIILQEGFTENVRKHRENNKSFTVLTLRYRRNRKGIYRKTLKHISRSSLRIYSNYQRIPRISSGMGVVILSTSRGIYIYIFINAAIVINQEENPKGTRAFGSIAGELRHLN